jgi:hypothetical protein
LEKKVSFSFSLFLAFKFCALSALPATQDEEAAAAGSQRTTASEPGTTARAVLVTKVLPTTTAAPTTAAAEAREEEEEVTTSVFKQQQQRKKQVNVVVALPPQIVAPVGDGGLQDPQRIRANQMLIEIHKVWLQELERRKNKSGNIFPTFSP